MIVVDGKKLAGEILDSLKKLPKPQKKLAAIFVGDSLASESFLKQKEKAANQLGVAFQLHRFPESISESDLKNKISEIASDSSVGGVIIQLPLPPQFKRGAILAALNPKTDLDALITDSRVLPPAVETVKDILASLNFDLSGKTVAVVGQGFLVGGPVGKWLENRCQRVIKMNSKSDLGQIREADLVITGVGKAGLINPAMLKSSAGLIDFGFSAVDGKIRGDFDSDSLNAIPYTPYPSFYTPTPGGTGPVLVAELFKNFYKLAGRQ